VRKKKRSKKRKKGRPVETAATIGKKQNAALLFPTVAWISRAKTVLGLSTVTTGLAVNLRVTF